MNTSQLRMSISGEALRRLLLSLFAIVALSPAVYADAGDDALAILLENTDGPPATYAVGLYLKEVGGPVLEQFNQSFVFEPASTIKVLHHVHAMLQVEAGNIALTDLIDTFTGSPDLPDCNFDCPNPCPVDVDPFQIQLQTALQQMMEQSHNTRTQAVRVWFGEANINATAQSLGMADSLIQHRIGCGGDAVARHNRLTLVDAGRLYEAVAANNILPNNRTTFYNLMSQSRFFDTVIDQEAASLGLTASEISDFKSQVAVAWKGGSYGLSDGQYRTLAGWVRFPFKCEGISREYVYGNFVNAADNLDTQGTGTNISVFNVGAALLRDVIVAALTSTRCARTPTITTPASDQTVECDGSGNVAALNAWLNSQGGASASDECGSISWSNDFLGLPNACGGTGSATVTFTATSDDGCQTSSSTTTATFTIADTTAPTIDTCPTDTTVECDGAGNVAELNAWLGSFAASDTCGDVTLSDDFSGLSDGCGGTGSATVTFTATDECGNDTTCVATFTIEDTVAPNVSCAVDISSLWPPAHNLVNVGLSVTVSDVCDENPQVRVEVYSDEGDEEATGDGNHAPDALDIAPDTLRLRAERKGDADGRVYLIIVTAEDECGNSSQACCTVTVPHNQSKAAKDSVAAQAASAEAYCHQNGQPPVGFVRVGAEPAVALRPGLLPATGAQIRAQ